MAVTYGGGLFVAVAGIGTGNRVMTSPDGATWTARSSAIGSDWSAIAYGNGMFVAVANTGDIAERVMTSPDGVMWTPRTGTSGSYWRGLAYGDGLFVAVSLDQGDVMTSSDGINWTPGPSAPPYGWRSMTFADGRFVAVASSGAGNRAMTGIVGSSASSTQDDAAPPSIQQGLPLPVSGRCADLAGADGIAAYGTSVTGGWVRGWEPWVGSTGGWACVRTIRWEPSGWTVA